MAQENKKQSFSKRQIDDLTGIYDDFLYMVRVHEDLLQKLTTDELANRQIGQMSSKNTNLLWQFAPLSDSEKQEFFDYVNNDTVVNNNHAYVALRHTNGETTCDSKHYAIPPYVAQSVFMELPSSIERYSVFYPIDGKLAKTEFFVDGEYKLFCADKDTADIKLCDFVTDPDRLQSFDIFLNIIDGFVKNNGMSGNFFNLLQESYADEQVSTNENNIIELVGLFAEKLVDVCRKKYNCKDEDTRSVLLRAAKDGLIKSLDEFNDYICLRHFLRHQWDTLDELSCFTSKKSEENKYKRNAYVNAYLKFCGKPRNERAKTYIDILHNMQFVITRLNPNWLVRKEDESNNQFFRRIKNNHFSKPGRRFTVETNYSLYDPEYERLSALVHKVLQNVNVAEDSFKDDDRWVKMNDYALRSWFIQNFKITECMVVENCLHRGENLNTHAAWKDVQSRGVISWEDSNTWDFYAEIRNYLSHNYFGEYARSMLLGVSDSFEPGFIELRNKLSKDAPDVHKVDKDVLRFTHKDGLDVELDYKHHTVAFQNIFPNKDTKHKVPHKETYPGGTEIDVWADNIVSVKLPIGVTVNIDDLRIDFDNQTSWQTNDKNLNGFFTPKSKLLTNKSLRVVESREKGIWQPFEGGDEFLIDYKHSVRLDSEGLLRQIKFKTKDNKIVQARLVHFDEGTNVMWFNDGTIISQSGDKMIVSHGGCVLNFNNRRLFASTYIVPENIKQKTVNTGHER